MSVVLITPLEEAGTEAFFRYLSDHLADNGSEATGYFFPQPRGMTGFPLQKETAFRQGLALPVGSPGWRRAWLARDEQTAIIGHVDLRSRPEPSTFHRCLLGLGVHRDHRGKGVGSALLEHIKVWAAAMPELAWIDLQVFATNAHAIGLYRKAGFVQTGQTTDMFRLDGQRIGDINMSLALR